MPIEQHFYTRTNRGYNTVARSAGLTDAFIRTQILPYSAHPIGAGDASISWVHLPNGQMLLGQSIKRGHIFFRHNYIIAAHQVDDALHAITRGVQFATSHDATQGTILPALDALPKHDHIPATTALPNTMYISAAQHAVIHGKRIYIPAPGEGTSAAVNAMAQLITILPTALRHLLGVCTSAGYTYEKRGIHLICTPQTEAIFKNPHILLDFGGKIDIMNDEAFFHARFAAMPELKFCTEVFDEIDFWMTRAPAIAHGEALRKALMARMSDVLDIHKLTITRAASWPEDFVRQGLRGRYTRYIGWDGAAFAPVDILRRAAHDNQVPDLNNYRLHHTVRKHIEQILQQI
ncbi:MAG: hypothetical protein FWC71_10165 [Defluviitaleaceae bacterium]|nr:hypothetical protein [Defluviitaleaceae bacterium]